MAESQLQDLLDRLQHGDDDAARELVEEYEPQIRRLIRLRLTDPRLRRVIDSVDVCQSVFGKFFSHARDGRLDLRADKLLALLSTMARNKVIERYRRESTRRPSGDTQFVYLESGEDLSATEPSPSGDIAIAELAEQAERLMTARERSIAAMRKSGLSWYEIGSEFGESKDAVRKQFQRAVGRVLEQLEWE
ncbi:MAG: sigma-70 family RNA polymerase sigma factor [Planctomycetota bacterium]